MFFKAEKSSEGTFLTFLNEYYKSFLLNFSCCVYMIAFLMVVCCIMYYMSYYKQYVNLRRRREVLRRANQRLARPHRPYAVYREHEVFRKVMRMVRQYQGRIGVHRPVLPVELIEPRQILICDVGPVEVSN